MSVGRVVSLTEAKLSSTICTILPAAILEKILKCGCRSKSDIAVLSSFALKFTLRRCHLSRAGRRGGNATAPSCSFFLDPIFFINSPCCLVSNIEPSAANIKGQSEAHHKPLQLGQSRHLFYGEPCYESRKEKNPQKAKGSLAFFLPAQKPKRVTELDLLSASPASSINNNISGSSPFFHEEVGGFC